MNIIWKLLLVGLVPFVAVSAPSAVSEDGAATTENAEADEAMPEGFARYQTILDRMPFGEPPPNYDPTLPPGTASSAAAAAAAAGEMTEAERTEEQQRVAAAVRVSVLNVNPSGQTMVGFTDSSVQPPEHHYIPLGVRRDGWLVKAVDTSKVDAETITLEKDGIEVTVKLGEGPQGDGKGGAKKGAAGGGARRPGLLAARPRQMSTAPAAVEASAGPGGAMARLRARREQQQQDEAKRRAEAAAEEKAEKDRRAAEAEAAAAERQQQRDALLQIQEELRRQREEKAAQQSQEGQQGEASETEE